MKNKLFSILITLIAIPAVLVLGVILYQGKHYQVMSVLIVVLACLPFFIAFERKKVSTREMVALAVMSALSVAGRSAFTTPSFKPVTAIVVITAIYFGAQAGFLTGAMSALVSNFFFGQGAWTPFQMFAWGIVGFIAGLLAPLIIKKDTIGEERSKTQKLYDTIKLLVFSVVYGAFSGVLFSLLMDVWTVLSMDGTFNLVRYKWAIYYAIPVTVIYAVSNVIFLAVLTLPLGKILERLKTKYGIFNY